MEDKLYCGIDLHKNFSTICIMNREGKVLEQRKLQHNGGMLKEFFKDKPELSCAVEPVENWGWLVDYLEQCKHEVHLANTYKTRLIAESRVKTDIAYKKGKAKATVAVARK